ncbi:hypothetical protein SAMN02746041_02411 [Desulfacinum hydrothermale DSM 13146]|uniref:Uncharacterized protein n=1 Tax=Desulfacinum hydrothermale DSM 13146 TaxID=1121390 RepID=A0A1W1XP90_9BACT|nr:hypothetical protein [Desulfacinum hydrothermale]SMC25684.1 hypothetical protein SAMN02746041_02411 [Desulfacinum hydrothermale DSM 13146]
MPVLNVTQEEYMAMKAVVLDGDKDEALRLIKAFLKRLEADERKALKSHLD